MIIDWTPLKHVIQNHQRFLVTTHVRPDGDALGSEVGVVGLLEHFGKDVRVSNVSPTPPRYQFLASGSITFHQFDPSRDANLLADREVLLILDLSSWSQLAEMADFVRSFSGPKVVIDHHVSQDDLDALVLKNIEAESTGTLVLQAARALQVQINPSMATGLLTAIAMDTGWFRHPNSKPETFRDAAELIEAGASIHQIYRLLFEQNSPGRLKLLGRILGNLGFESEGRIAYGIVSTQDFAETFAVPPDTEDVIDQIAGIAGVEVAMLFIEQRTGQTKVSFRSRGEIDVASLAEIFGGGGHRAAAGALCATPLIETQKRVVEVVKQALSASHSSGNE